MLPKLLAFNLLESDIDNGMQSISKLTARRADICSGLIPNSHALSA